MYLKLMEKLLNVDLILPKIQKIWKRFQIQVKLLVLKMDANRAKIEHPRILKGIC